VKNDKKSKKKNFDDVFFGMKAKKGKERRHE
jgi:hypothetical protein